MVFTSPDPVNLSGHTILHRVRFHRIRLVLSEPPSPGKLEEGFRICICEQGVRGGNARKVEV